MHTTTFGVISKGSQSSERERWLKFQQADAVSNNDYSLNAVILHSDEVSELISVEVLFQLIQTSMNMTLVADALKKRTGKSDVFNIKLLPFTSAVFTTFLHHQAQTTLK